MNTVADQFADTLAAAGLVARGNILLARGGAPVLTPGQTGGKPNGRAQILKFETRKHRGVNYKGPRARDRRLDFGQEPPLGAHIVTPRRGYTHHGIYVGRGNVVQYGGLVRGLRRGPVEEVALTQFAQGHPVWVRSEESPRFDAHEVVRRACSRVGEDRYHLLTNNCEHFCEWCRRAEHRSYQVDRWLSYPGRLLQMIRGLTAKLLTVREVRDA
jgi:hypothetical protein